MLNIKAKAVIHGEATVGKLSVETGADCDRIVDINNLTMD
jgi:hypothetical protein